MKNKVCTEGGKRKEAVIHALDHDINILNINIYLCVVLYVFSGELNTFVPQVLLFLKCQNRVLGCCFF